MNKERKNRIKGIAFIFMLSGLLSGCIVTGPHPEESLSFSEAEQRFEMKDYSAAADLLSRFLYDHRESSAQTARAFRMRGECRQALEKYSLARADYLRAVRAAEARGVYFENKLTFVYECKLLSNETYMLEGAFRSADRALQKLLWKKPPVAIRDRILYYRYICAMKMKSADAKKHLASISDMSHVNERELKRAFLDRTPMGKEPRKPLYKPKKLEPISTKWKTTFVPGQWVVIDAGHGGKDPGAISVLGYYEKDLNLAVASRLAQALRSMGVRVEMTRDTDRFIELNDRAEVGNRLHAGLFVSLHADSAANSSANGYTIYIDRSAAGAEKAAARIVDQALGAKGFKSRGVRPAGFRVLTRSNGPAMLVEMGFLSNPEEADRMRKGAFIQSMSQTLAQGIAEYLRVTAVDT